MAGWLQNLPEFNISNYTPLVYAYPFLKQYSSLYQAHLAAMHASAIAYSLLSSCLG